MNYRHGFHAGNFADVVKHAILSRILVYLAHKDAPFRFIDTHAGAGRYDMTGAEANRSPEWREGVARLLKASPPGPVSSLLEPYLRAIGQLRRERNSLVVPGVAGNRANPDAAAGPARALRGASGGARKARRRARARRAAQHCWNRRLLRTQRLSATKGAPRNRPDRPAVRGGGRKRRVEKALARAIRKWSNGIYLAWRPIREEAPDAHFLNNIAALGAPNILRIELDVGPGPVGAQGQMPLARAGLLVINPPHTLIDEARILMPWLARLLGRDGRASHVCEWLAPPR